MQAFCSTPINEVEQGLVSDKNITEIDQRLRTDAATGGVLSFFVALKLVAPDISQFAKSLRFVEQLAPVLVSQDLKDALHSTMLRNVEAIALAVYKWHAAGTDRARHAKEDPTSEREEASDQ